jgi:hypothetical protein
VETEIEYRESYVFARVRGNFDLGEAKHCYTDVLSEAVERSIPNLLIDCRAMTGNLSTVDRYSFWDYVAKENIRALTEGGKGLAFRIALAMKEPLFDPSRFGQTVARNRGVAVFVTEDLAEACRWLGIDIPA